MANSLGTITPVVIAQQALDILSTSFPVITSFTTDFSDEAVYFGATINSRIPQLVGVQSFDTTNGYVPTSAVLTNVSVTVNQHKHTSISFNDQEMASTPLNLVEQFSNALAYQAGNDIMSGVAALFTSGNFPSVVALTGVAATRTNAIIPAKVTLDTSLVPENDRHFISNPTTQGQLLSDPSLVKLTYGAQGIKENGVPDGLGFQMGLYNNLALAAVAFQSNAVMIASRPVSFPDAQTAGFAKITNVTDPRCGLTIQVREIPLPWLGKYQVSYIWMYGVAVGNSASLVRITA